MSDGTDSEEFGKELFALAQKLAESFAECTAEKEAEEKAFVEWLGEPHKWERSLTA